MATFVFKARAQKISNLNYICKKWRLGGAVHIIRFSTRAAVARQCVLLKHHVCSLVVIRLRGGRGPLCACVCVCEREREREKRKERKHC